MDFLGDSTVPVGDVQKDWGNFDTQNNTIGLNEVTVDASKDYSFYDPLYTGVSFAPLKVDWINSGMGGSGFKTEYKMNYSTPDIAANIVGAAGLTWDATRYGVMGAQKLGNAAGGTLYAIQDFGKLKLIKGVTVEMGGKLVAGLGIAITGYDIYNNGLNWSNGTDLVMGGVAFIPGVGWVISGVYFIGNIAVEHYTGKSIGEHIGEGLQDPNIQRAVEQLATGPW